MTSDSQSQSINEVLAALYARKPESQIRPRLEPTRRLVEMMGNPQNNYKIIHITGTNGKSSTARMIERLLREHGLRTGRLTSPHLVSFNERIALDGEPVEDQLIIEAYQENLVLLQLVDQELTDKGEGPLTFFEAFTALAFHVFSDAPIDVLVLEVGIGGEWDATNVADADVAVFTAIDLDHQETLGDTVEEIAQTKAGITKQNSIVVSSFQRPSVASILRARALQEVFMAGEEFGYSEISPDGFGTRFSVRGIWAEYPELWMPIIGQHQAENAATAIVATEAFLGRAIADEVLRSAFADSVSPGRLQVVSKQPLVVIDGAHNPAGLVSLRNSIQWHFGAPRAIGVVGMLREKDIQSSAQELIGVFDHLIVTSAPGERGILASELANSFSDEGLIVDEIVPEFWSAYEQAIRLGVSTDRPVFITGSLYLVGAVLEKLQLENSKPSDQDGQEVE
ncbi:MAG: bifunctional folylpolyglutamate synthase/dihydrofolate synthase [Aquiluna sp.]|jgi:dihydrofolate synthase/folylpolyglutamate synthase|nr:bifunctional folylpolyglutamate synthase/dihydrofolate synthase [Aquiluna sp.]